MWHSSESLIAATISRLDLAGSLRTAVIESSKDIVYEHVKDHFFDTFSGKLTDVLLNLGAETAGRIASQMGVRFIKAIWTQNNIVTKQLERLVREPFRTGLRTAQEAFLLPFEDDQQREFRERRLETAINKLEEAQSLLKGSNTLSHDKFIICLMISVCSSNVRGGSHHARAKAYECINMIEDALIPIHKNIKMYQRDIEEHYRESEECSGERVAEPGSMVEFWQKNLSENIAIENNLRDLQAVLSIMTQVK